MRFFLQGLFMLIVSLPINAQDIFIPKQFEEGRLIEQLILISDVDGVIREGTDATADARIIQAVKSLLNHSGVDVTFISGTPVDNDPTVEPWRGGNLSLRKVFGSSFKQELLEGRVSIYGVLGGHCMRPDGTLQIVDEYSPEISFEIEKLLIQAFLKEVLHDGNDEQKEVANALQIELEALKSSYMPVSANLTANEFYPIITVIHQYLDPHFRLIANGALIETQTSDDLWSTSLSSKWLQQEMNQPHHLVSSLPQSQKQVATGLVKRADWRFNYLLIGKTHKGTTTQKLIEEKLKQFPNALIVTIGDTQVDYPMHQNAHLAFHVGLEQIWRNHPLPHCMMIRSPDGKDAQHVEGTLQVLKLLNEAIGKSFYDLGIATSRFTHPFQNPENLP